MNPVMRHPDATELQHQQLALLQTLLAELKTNAFYAPVLRKAGLAQGVPSVQAFRDAMPFTTKQAIVEDQRDHPPFGTNLTYPLDRYTRFHQTSGTTGSPIRWLDTPESWQWMLDNWAAVYDAAGASPGDVAFFAFSFGPFLGFWTAFEAATRAGLLAIPGGGMSSVARLRAIIDHQATILCCTPTYAMHLGQVAHEHAIDLTASKVRAIIVAGEPGGSLPATRDRLQQVWPTARVWDHHGMTEVGPVSLECPLRPGVLHIIEPAYLAEVINPGTECNVGPDDLGELVLTTLGRTGSPLLRYRTGDIVRYGAPVPCICGRSTTTLPGGILGRADDMVIIRGVNIYPSSVDELIRAIPGIAEYEVHVKAQATLPEMTIRIEPAAGYGNADRLARQLADSLRDALGLRIPVEAVLPGTLPRFEMKARRWIRS